MIDAYALKGLPYLKVLELSLRSLDLELNDKLPYLDQYTDLDIVRTPLMRSLLELRGLRTVKILDAACYSPKTREQEQRWSGLLRQVEKVLTDVITKPRSVHGVQSHRPSVSSLLKSDQYSRSLVTQTAYDTQQQRSIPSQVIGKMPEE